MRRVRKRDRSWLAVLAGSLGLYAVLAVGFYWFVEPAIRAGRSNLPTETLTAYRSQLSEEPATSGHALRGTGQIPVEKSEPPRPPDPLTTAKAEQADSKAPESKAPKKESPRNVTRHANDRPVQRSAERRGAAWNFSSSPASPNYR
jgi:hypothetical protein